MTRQLTSTEPNTQHARGEGTADGGPVATGGGTSWNRLTGFQRDLIKSVRSIEEEERVPTGKTVKAEIEALYGEDINHGRLYQNLNQLVERECIDKVVVDGRTNAYYLTDGAIGMLDDAAMEFIEACELEDTSLES